MFECLSAKSHVSWLRESDNVICCCATHELCLDVLLLVEGWTHYICVNSGSKISNTLASCGCMQHIASSWMMWTKWIYQLPVLDWHVIFMNDVCKVCNAFTSSCCVYHSISLDMQCTGFMCLYATLFNLLDDIHNMLKAFSSCVCNKIHLFQWC